MRRLRSLALIASLGWATTVSADALLSSAQALFKPIPATPPALPGNEATPAKIELGKMLYFDPRLSASHTISCNSCHNVGLAGADGNETSIGHKWQRGGRNAPTVFNAVFNTTQFWDGRAKDLEEQAGGPMVNPVEMAAQPDQVAELLASIPGYVSAFKAAFPDEANPVSLANAQKAIAVFEATLITPNAPFDRYLQGDTDALTATQKEGLELFINRGCAGCHNGVNLGGDMFVQFGMVQKPGEDLLPPQDKGRFDVTQAASDEYVFRTPTLRNIALTAPYFHTGRTWDLGEAVRVMATTQLGIQLTAQEVDKIVAFLESLTGEQPKVAYPTLPPSAPDTPKPQS